MVRMLDLLSVYLRGRGYLFQRLDGSMSSKDRQLVRSHRQPNSRVDFADLWFCRLWIRSMPRDRRTFVSYFRPEQAGLVLTWALPTQLLSSIAIGIPKMTYRPNLELTALDKRISSTFTGYSLKALVRRPTEVRGKCIANLFSWLTVEETILERAKKKLVLDQLVIQRLHKNNPSQSKNFWQKNEINDIIKFGVRPPLPKSVGLLTRLTIICLPVGPRIIQ